MKSGTIAGLVLGLVAGVVLAILVMQIGNRLAPAPIIIETAAPLPTAAPPPTPAPTATLAPLRVYLTGEVAQPGVFELPPGSIVEDAVLAAGGFTERAEVEALNLAQRLADGMHIHVPVRGEAATIPPISGGDEPPDGATGQPLLVNINTATAEELAALPGIGPAIAEAIIAYRQDNGFFTTTEQVMDVPGIGESKYEQIRGLITTGG
jgi:competence protein ComEA